MSVVLRLSLKCIQFYDLALAAGLLAKMNPVTSDRLEKFVKAFNAAQQPDTAMRNYKLALVPFAEVFTRTRLMLKSTISLLEAWSALAGNEVALKAETGAWLLGEDEADDLTRLELFHAVFVKAFGSAGLPPQLKADALKKQVAEHHKASREKPTQPVGQKRSELESEQRLLAAEATALFRAYHDFLDGYFGTSGDEAFANKQKFAYDRRALRSGKKATEKEPVAPPAAPPIATE